MDRVEKTVFLSYRRTNIPWALAIFQNLTHHGFDVFFDYRGIASGDFEQVIIGNIRARAHFLVLLTPSALERCQDEGDWLRREIETALESRRNIVPLLLEGFDFGSPGIANRLTGTLSALKNYNGVRIPHDYFDAGMERLRTSCLNVPLEAVLHPAPAAAQRAATEQTAAARLAPLIQREEMTAQEWFERGVAATDLDEKLNSYDQAIRLKPDFAEAFNNRGLVHHEKRDLEGAIRDYNEAIRLKRDYAEAFNNRGFARYTLMDREGANRDYNEAIRLKPNYAQAFYNRGDAHFDQYELEEAIREYNEAIRLKPDFSRAFTLRGRARQEMGDLDGAIRDLNEALRVKPDSHEAFYYRANIFEQKSRFDAAIADYEKYLDLTGEQNWCLEKIRDLKAKL